MPAPGPSGQAAAPSGAAVTPDGGAVTPDGAAVAPPDDAGLLTVSLEALAGREGEVVERFYALFFSRHPEVRALFGEHSISEREEMISETLVSVMAHADAEPWLDDNLVAMGRSHAEYGVEGHSYPDFVASMLDTLDGLDLDGWGPDTRAAWERALARITGVMRRAGDEVGGAA